MACCHTSFPVLRCTATLGSSRAAARSPEAILGRSGFCPLKWTKGSSQRPTAPRIVSVRSAKQGDKSAETPPWSEPGYMGAAISSMPETTQAAVVAGIFTALGVGTAISCSVIGPTIANAIPDLFAFSKATWPILGVTYVAAGIAHFGVEQGFLDMYPHRGAWGIYYLPGSPSFHVQWTGVAEALGGAGMLIGALPLEIIPSWVEPASAAGLFALTWAVTPANIYMYTHNAPGPLPEGTDPVLPWQGHLARGVLQVFLLSILWGLANP